MLLGWLSASLNDMNRTIVISLGVALLAIAGLVYALSGSSIPASTLPPSTYAKDLVLKSQRDGTNPAMHILTIASKPGAKEQGTINFAGWKLKSRISGYEYPFPQLVGAQYTYKGIPPTSVSEPISINANRGDQVIVQERGAPANDSITVTNDLTIFHVNIGAQKPVWGARDIVDLIDASEALVASTSI